MPTSTCFSKHDSYVENELAFQARNGLNYHTFVYKKLVCRGACTSYSYSYVGVLVPHTRTLMSGCLYLMHLNLFLFYVFFRFYDDVFYSSLISFSYVLSFLIQDGVFPVCQLVVVTLLSCDEVMKIQFSRLF